MIKNRVVICLVVVITMIQTGVATARRYEDPMEIFGTQIDISLESGVNITSHNIPLRQNWQEMFSPASEGMKPSKANFPWASGLRLGLNRVLIGNNQTRQIRLLVSYQILSLNFYRNPTIAQLYFAKEGVAVTTLNWWDTVVVNDLVIEYYTPRVGIEFVEEGKYTIAISAQHYRLVARDYLGEDHLGAVNTSEVISSRQIESGVSLRVDFLSGGVCGWFIETMRGLKTVKLGLTVRWKIQD